MSYVVNALFCLYCAHSTGNDKPLQKIHDDKVSKVDMCIVVEKLRALQLVMVWGIVFGVIFSKVGDSGA